MILLTTSDYLPKLGGITTFTLNIERVLKKFNIEYKLIHWKSYSEILNFPQQELDKASLIINIHSAFHQFMRDTKTPVINFFHGAEILFYSKNPIKNFVKKMTKINSIKKLSLAKYNIFVSEFTYQVMIKNGLKSDYSRDLIFNVMVDTAKNEMVSKKISDSTLKFVCVARDVPHKNFAGTIEFCEQLAELAQKKIELFTITNKKFHSNKIKIHSIINPSNEERDQYYKVSHFNLLFSLDHSKRGFFEGFGQVVQEAALFATPSIVLNTGGLSESVHHNFTGFVLNNLKKDSILNLINSLSDLTYKNVSQNCFNHTIHSHDLSNWEILLRKLLKL